MRVHTAAQYRMLGQPARRKPHSPVGADLRGCVRCGTPPLRSIVAPMNTAIAPIINNTKTPHRLKVRQLGLAILAAAVVSSSACGSSTSTAPTAPPNAPTTAATSPESTTPAASSTATTDTDPPTTTVTTVARPTATIDQLVGAEGARVHVRCVGHGDTTVVLIASFGGDNTGWVKVEPALAVRARVCSYERPGTGTSDPATSTATFTTQATELHALLLTIGEPGPYVVVGHSFGGAEAVTFASRFADEVTGVAHIVSLGSLPMAIITATRRELPADLAASEVARLNMAWNQGQQAWAALSTSAHLVSVEHTRHHIEIDQPAIVIDEITRLLP